MTQMDFSETTVYQGQFGNFTITDSDRTGVIVYRIGLAIAALSFGVGTALVLWFSDRPEVIKLLTPLYACFCLALGVSLVTIHIYMGLLHRLLQVFWAIGLITAALLTIQNSEPLALTVYNHPATLFGIGFTFVALTGIYFKEAFCFNRLETKLLTPLVPVLLLGHLMGILSDPTKKVLLGFWAILFVVFALRKVIQPIPPDIGDKSVFAYLKTQNSAKA